MAEFSVNTHRLDPYKNYKFRVKWDGQYVAGLQKCGGLKKTVEVVEWKEAGNPNITRRLHGRTSWQPIVLEAGLTHDTAFEKWAKLVNDFGTGALASLVKYRKDLTIEMMNEMGQVVLAYKVYRAWVSEYQAVPDLDSNGHAVAISSIKLENEGWERDDGVSEPHES